MTIFNSLGSNYNFAYALKALFIPNNKKYNEKLIALLEKKYDGKAIVTYKGREALYLAFSLLRNKKKKIAINGFTCYAVYEAIEKAGYEALLIDIEKNGINFSPEVLEDILKKEEVAAVIIQNTLGYPCDIERIEEICRKNSVVLIEDLAHSVGAVYQSGREAGTVGDMVILSFSQDKIIDAVSGGALIIRNEEYKENIQNPKRIGKKRDRVYPLFTVLIRNFYPVFLGKIFHFILKKTNLLSAPMDGYVNPASLPSWQSKLALAEFENHGKNLKWRREIAAIYEKGINDDFLKNEITKNISNSSNLRFPIFLKNREKLIKYLRKNGVYISDIWYDAPIAPRRFMSKTKYNGECPNSEDVSNTILNLPTHKNVSKKDAQSIVEIINKWEKLQ